MPQLDAGQAAEEVARGAAALKAAVGSAGWWFRPSGTPHSTATIRAAAARERLPAVHLLRRRPGGLPGPRRSACEDQNTPTRPPWIDHQPPPRPCWDRASAPRDPVRPVDRRTAAGHAVRAAPGLSHATAQGAARRRHAGSADGAAARGLFLGPGPLGARRRCVRHGLGPRVDPRGNPQRRDVRAGAQRVCRERRRCPHRRREDGAAHGLRAQHPVRHACSSSTPAPTRSSPASAPAASRSTWCPSWDLKTLWVNDDLGNDLVPIDPRTGKAGKPVAGRGPLQPLLHPRRRARPGHGRAPAPHRRPRPAHDGAAALAAGALRRDQPRRLLRRPVLLRGQLRVQRQARSSSTRTRPRSGRSSTSTPCKTPGATTPHEAMHMHGSPKHGLRPGATRHAAGRPPHPRRPLLPGRRHAPQRRLGHRRRAP